MPKATKNVTPQASPTTAPSSPNGLTPDSLASSTCSDTSSPCSDASSTCSVTSSPSSVSKNVTCKDCSLVFSAELKLIRDPNAQQNGLRYSDSVQCPGCKTTNDKEMTFQDEPVDDVEPQKHLYDFTKDIAYDKNSKSSYTLVNQSKGDCCFVQHGPCLIVYDFGFGNMWSKLEDRLDKIRQTAMAIQMAILIISHPDKDHVGNFKRVVAYITAAWQSSIVVVSKLGKNHDLFKCNTKSDLKVGKWSIEPSDLNTTLQNLRKINTGHDTVLSCKLSSIMSMRVHFPPRNKNNNLNCLVAVLRVNNRVVLLTGDQHQDFIDEVISKENILRTFIQQLPHHCSTHNLNGNELTPSKYFIGSGVPLNDKNATSFENTYNQSCQDAIVNMLMALKCSPEKLLLTEKRVTEKLAKRAKKKKSIDVVAVDECYNISLD